MSRYILDTGFHFGEWLEPGDSNLVDAMKAMLCPDAEVATGWFYYSLDCLAEVSDILGENANAEYYKKYADCVREAYRSRFVSKGRIVSKRQCKYVRPLYFGLLDEKEAEQAAKDLAQLCKTNEYKIGTGFLSTYQLLPVLCDNGFSDVAYKIMENTECPGWLYEVEKGATTIWEGWDAIRPDGHLTSKSMNHYAPGASVAWLFEYVCGIKNQGYGFDRIEIAPIPGGSLTYATAEYKSMYGLIKSGWKIENGEFILELIIPDAIEATVKLPDGKIVRHAKSGRYQCEYKITGNEVRNTR